MTISLRLMTFWWCSFFRILISRMAVIGNCAGSKRGESRDKHESHNSSHERGRGILTPSRSLSIRIFFRATISFVSFSFAMKTCLETITNNELTVLTRRRRPRGIGELRGFQDMRTRRCPPRSAQVSRSSRRYGNPMTVTRRD